MVEIRLNLSFIRFGSWVMAAKSHSLTDFRPESIRCGENHVNFQVFYPSYILKLLKYQNGELFLSFKIFLMHVFIVFGLLKALF